MKGLLLFTIAYREILAFTLLMIICGLADTKPQAGSGISHVLRSYMGVKWLSLRNKHVQQYKHDNTKTFLLSCIITATEVNVSDKSLPISYRSENLVLRKICSYRS
jgi:hypothetical protein